MDINTIYNMNCLDGMRQLDDNSIDVSFTSPPYNRIRDDTYEHFCDVSDDYYQMLVDVTDEMLRVTEGYVIINIQMNHFNKVELCKWIGKYAEYMRGNIVWEKSNPQPASNPKDDTFSVTNAYENFYVLSKGEDEFRAYNKVKNHITTNVNSEHFEGHGAVMKREVAEWFIRNFTKRGDLILDPFMGMGTTAVVCATNNRNYIGYEISEEYHKRALKRIDDEVRQIRFDFEV